MKRNLLLILAAMACMFMACSEKSENKKPSEETPVVELYSYTQLDNFYTSGAGDNYSFIMAYGPLGKTLFSKITEVTFEMYSGDDLLFFVGYMDNYFSSPILTNDKDQAYSYSQFMYDNPSRWPGLDYEYWKQLDVVIPGEGTYVFRLKFYLPETDYTFYSPKYSLTVVRKEFSEPGTHQYYYYGNPEKIQ